MKTFPIDFVRQVIEQTLEEEHIKEPKKYFGGEQQVNLFSFYEQLQKEDEVNRYVEMYRELTEQQNRLGLIMNGTIIAPENPTITNLNNCLIIPMTFTCSFRVRLGDRDSAIETINNLFDILKGRKRDIAYFENGQLFVVGTIANNVKGQPRIENGSFIGSYNQTIVLNNWLNTTLNGLVNNYGLLPLLSIGDYVFAEDSSGGHHRLKAIKITKISPTYEGEFVVSEESGIFVPPNIDFEKYKLSISFDSLRCDQPITLNSEEYCTISFGGSATLVSNGVKLGNDLTKLGIAKNKIKAKVDIEINGNTMWLEPLEIPSGNNANTKINQLISNKFISNSHTNSLGISLQYTFVVDETISLIKQWFEYGRYGIQADGTTISYANGITPNMIYQVKEIWSSWGEIDIKTFLAKIVESVDIESTESDTLTISIPLQLQGEND